MNTVLT